MDNNKFESLVEYLSNKLPYNHQLLMEKVQEWQALQTEPVKQQLTFEVIALYDKGFGPECMNLPLIKVDTVEKAQAAAEEMATRTFLEKFQGKIEWEEIKIRPAK